MSVHTNVLKIQIHPKIYSFPFRNKSAVIKHVTMIIFITLLVLHLKFIMCNNISETDVTPLRYNMNCSI